MCLLGEYMGALVFRPDMRHITYFLGLLITSTLAFPISICKFDHDTLLFSTCLNLLAPASYDDGGATFGHDPPCHDDFLSHCFALQILRLDEF